MNVTDFSLEAKSTRWGEAISASALTRRPIEYIANSTYNEFLDVLPQEHFDTSEIPVVQYIGMGIGSDYMTEIAHPVSKQVIDNPSKYIHSNNDAIPFIPFPYVMRKVGEDDLSISEREKYAMRAIVSIDNQDYVAYYLRRAETTNDKIVINVVTTDSSGQVTDISPLEPSAAPLEPKRDPDYTGETPSTNEYLKIRSTLRLDLSAGDIAEVLNCASIMFGTTDIEITEFSMVGGIEKSHVVADGGSNITYNEVIAAQSAGFSPLSFSAAQRADVGFSIEFKIGQSMSMS